VVFGRGNNAGPGRSWKEATREDHTIRLRIGGVLVGIVVALALGASPPLLIAGASVLACPLAMYLCMRTMGGPQDARPTHSHNAAAPPEPRRTPDAANANATC
jgi:hypothetical protein